MNGIEFFLKIISVKVMYKCISHIKPTFEVFFKITILQDILYTHGYLVLLTFYNSPINITKTMMNFFLIQGFFLKLSLRFINLEHRTYILWQ